MDRQTGEIAGLKELVEKAFGEGRDTRHIVEIGRFPDKNCPLCEGTGKGSRDPETLLWNPCRCTQVAAGKGHSATFHRLNGKC